jgi:hypothetical protein
MSWNLRLSRLVKQELKSHSANWIAARMTEEVRKVHSGVTIHGRFIKALANDPYSVSFTIYKLVALDLYFRGKGHSLKDEPIFEKRGLLECLIEPRTVTFLLGAKPRVAVRTHDVSRWDTRCLADVISGALGKVSEEGGRLDSEIEDVVLRGKVDQAEFQRERWYNLVERDKHSLVALGSPHACLASEVMLARMLGVTPFSPPSLDLAGRKLFSFCFAWPQKYWARPSSSFALDWRKLSRGELRTRLQHSRSWAFVLDGTIHYMDIKGDQWTMYGIVAAQRRKGNNVWVVLSGITGPATLAAARLLRDIEAELPWPAQGRHGDVLWLPYKATITTDASRDNRGDMRQVTAVEAMGEPRIVSRSADGSPPQC